MALGTGEDENGKRSRVLTHPLLIAVVPALIVAAGTYFAGARTGHVLGLAPTPTATVTVTAAPHASGGRGSGGSGTQTASGKLLIHKNAVQLTNGYGLSFTDPQLRPFPDGSCSGAQLYICNGNGTGSSAELADYQGKTGFSGCKTDTSYANGTNIFGPLVGHTLCITTIDRIAACYVTQDTTQQSGPAPGLTMDCTVYSLK